MPTMNEIEENKDTSYFEEIKEDHPLFVCNHPFVTIDQDDILICAVCKQEVEEKDLS